MLRSALAWVKTNAYTKAFILGVEPWCKCCVWGRSNKSFRGDVKVFQPFLTSICYSYQQ